MTTDQHSTALFTQIMSVSGILKFFTARLCAGFRTGNLVKFLGSNNLTRRICAERPYKDTDHCLNARMSLAHTRLPNLRPMNKRFTANLNNTRAQTIHIARLPSLIARQTVAAWVNTASYIVTRCLDSFASYSVATQRANFNSYVGN